MRYMSGSAIEGLCGSVCRPDVWEAQTKDVMVDKRKQNLKTVEEKKVLDV